MVILPAAAALSAFRLERLRADLAERGVTVPLLRCGFLHALDMQGELSPTERERLDRMLQPAGDEPFCTQEQLESGSWLFVMPRAGTISPWSSKATDIAHHCGFAAVQRVERITAY